jgi:F-box interacting protein
MEEGGTKRRRLVVRLRLPRRAATLPKELLVEIFSWLPVKQVVQLRCLNKFFKTLIFDPYFVDLHLNKSQQQQQQLAITYRKLKDNTSRMETLSIPRLLRNKSPIFHQNTDPDRLLNGYSRVQLQRVVASCNGLVCLFSVSYPSGDQWICFWNPAIRTKSIKFPVLFFSHNSNYYVSFSFGYDNSTRTYKLVVFYMEMDFEPGSLLLKVFSFGGDDDDNSCWRDIQCSFPVLPLFWHHDNIKTIDNKGAHLNGTINWIVLRDYKINTTVVSVDQYVILSLDLSTEKCTQLLLPQRFDEKLWHTPKLVVLMGCLCFCHDFEETHFVIWQMKNFGVQESWIQLFQISYEGKFFRWVNLWPLYLSENHDTLILANDEVHEAFIYNHRRNKVHKIGITNDISWSEAINYVESLVSTR